MNTIHDRRKAVGAAAIGTILLALSAPMAHAAPGYGPGDNRKS